jgi:lysophospholipase L1-like esterase
MKKQFLLIVLIVVTLGCKSEIVQPLEQQDKDRTTINGLKYLALGDSYTIGEGVAETQRYPVQLGDSLKKYDILLDSIRIIARTGWTTDELSRAIDQATLAPPYDLVTLLIGVNNQYRGRTPENYRQEFTQLLIGAISFAGNDPKRVIIISIPDWGVTPFAQGRDQTRIAEEIDAFNAINKQEAINAGVYYINVTPVSREAATRLELLAPDGLHPSGLMYALWVKDLLPIAKDILKKP